MSEIIRDENPTARKPHGCDCCNRTIEPGEKYRRCVALGDCGLCTWKTCTHCRAFVRMYYDDIAGWFADEGIGPDDINEWEPETAEASEHKWQWKSKWRNGNGELLPVIEQAGKPLQRISENATRAAGPDEALKMALELIGKQPDVVAVKLPEPTHSGNVSTSWGWVTQWHPTHQVNGETRLITVDDPGRCLNVTQARDLAAALLAAAARAEAADGAR